MTNEAKKNDEVIDEDITLDLKFEPADDVIVLIRNSEIDIRKSGIALSKKDEAQYTEIKSYEDTEHYRVIAAGPNKREYKHNDRVILRANAELEWFNQDGKYYYITNTYAIAGRVSDDIKASITVKKSTLFDPNMNVINAPVKPVIKTQHETTT